MHWSFTRLRTLKATNCLIHAQLVQVQKYSRGDIHSSHYAYSPLVINTMTCKHMKFLRELVWSERMFFPIVSLFSGDQVTKPEEQYLYLYFSIHSLALQYLNLPALYPNPELKFSLASETQVTVVTMSLGSIKH